MELKEIVNLRKLREYYEDTLEEELCEYCPFREVCVHYYSKSRFDDCLIEKMLGIEVDNRDLYELEADGDLTEDYQIRK